MSTIKEWLDWLYKQDPLPPVPNSYAPNATVNPLDFNDRRMLSHYVSPATSADFIGEPDQNGMVAVSDPALVAAIKAKGARNCFAIADTFYAFPNMSVSQRRALTIEITSANALAALMGGDNRGFPANCGYGFAFSNGDLDPAHRGVWLRNLAQAIATLPVVSDTGMVAGPR